MPLEPLFDGVGNGHRKSSKLNTNFIALSKRQIKETNTFCSKCLLPKSYTKRSNMCKECGDKLFITNLPLRKMVEKPFDKIGVEMEGMWDYDPCDCVSHLERRDDCSVENDRDEDVDWCGEYVFSRPQMMYNDRWKNMVRDGYPTYVNETAGGHFHTSLKDARFYEILMEENMGWSIRDHMMNWGNRNLNSTGLERLSSRIIDGNSDYCKISLQPETQVCQDGSDCRYTFFNYPWNKHGTIECRFLPQFDCSDVYLKAVDEIIGFMTSYVQNRCGAKFWSSERTYGQVKFEGQISKSEVRRYLRRTHSFTSIELDTLVQ